MARQTHPRHTSEHPSPTQDLESMQSLYSMPLPRHDTASEVARDIDSVATRLDALSEKLRKELAD